MKRDAAGEEEDRDVIGGGLGDTAEGVLGAGLILHGDDTEALAVAGAAEAIGGHDGASFVSEGDRADALLGDGFDQGVGGEAGHPLDAFALEDLGDEFVAVHGVLASGCGGGFAAPRKERGCIVGGVRGEGPRGGGQSSTALGRFAPV